MPPPSRKKEPKEAVSYTFQKRKAAPFIPQRPSKVLRADPTQPDKAVEASRPGVVGRTQDTNKPFNRARVVSNETQSLTKQRGPRGVSPARSIESLSSDASLDEQLLAHEPVHSRNELAAANENPPIMARNSMIKHTRAPSPLESQTSFGSSQLQIQASPQEIALPQAVQRASHAATRLPSPVASSDVTGIHRPLLLRILHERFRSKDTKIDEHAIAILQKYFEIFIREAIARAALAKQKAVDEGRAALEDRDWLEIEELERIAPGMILDF